MDIWSKVTNPLIFEENRLPAHAEFETFIPNGNNEMVSNRFLKLDGLWKFCYAENRRSIPNGFTDDNYNCDDWDEIKVPGHIQLQGYDKPHYTNVAYPWDAKENLAPGQVPERFNPVGCYIKTFELKTDDFDDKIILSLQGVESGAAIYVNGQYAGYMENSFGPSEFDITPYVRAGENRLSMEVYKWTSGSWCEDQDFFRFSGIYRSVYLYKVGKKHLRDFKVRTVLSEDYKTAVVKTELSYDSPLKIRYSLYEIGDGTNPTINFDTVADKKKCAEGQTKGKQFEIMLNQPMLWSAEIPNLYRLVIEVLNDDESIAETIFQNIGVRSFAMEAGIMKINGKRIVFNGVNRHEFSCYTGRNVSDEEILKDILIMKRNNINAVRTSHYPDDVRIYNLFDRYGLYVIGENNMETHGTWNYEGKNPESFIPRDNLDWEPMLLDRVNTCYQRDKNHPSIVIWSCGNESYGGLVIKHMSDLFHKLDPDRLVHYEGIFMDRRYNDTSDMESQMYTPAADIERFLEEHPEKPFICCEYTHAMANSCGAMHKYTELSHRNEKYQGGFIWDFIDQSIITRTIFGEEYQGYGGDFDDRPSSYEFSGNGIVYGDRTESPKMQEVKFNYQNIRIDIDEENIRITNYFLFRELKDFDFTAQLLRNGEVIEEKVLDITEEKDIVILKQPFSDRKTGAEYSIIVSAKEKKDTIWCAAGYEIAFGQYVFKADDNLYFGTKDETATEFEIIPGRENLGVRGKDFSIILGGEKGGIVSYVYKGKEYIKGTPKPNFWRAPTSNDNGCGMQMKYAQWKIASLYMDHRTPEFWANGGPKIEPGPGYLKVSLKQRLSTTPEAFCDVEYKIYPDGRVAITMSYEPVVGLGDPLEFGFIFKLDALNENITWYGIGPSETYADRKHGGKIGVYSGKVKEQLAKYLVPQECGNKEETRVIRVTDNMGAGLEFTSDKPFCASVLPYSPHELENAMHAFELPKSHYTYVRCALAQKGIGGDNSWGADAHPEYHLPKDEPLKFTVIMKGI